MTAVNLDDVPLTADIELAKNKLQPVDNKIIIAEIKALLMVENAVLIAHYYVDDDIQELAEQTGGIVADSLEMARFGKNHPAQTLVVAGVRFMGETAKILNPEKRVLMLNLKAECSLDLGCNAEDLQQLADRHPDRKIVVYSNTSVAVKAAADFVVTSGIAVKVVEKLHQQNQKILWAPDKHLGEYIQKTTGADMLLWDATCVVHDEFKAESLRELTQQYPKSAVLVHPESPRAIIQMADFVGSTTQLINHAKTIDNPTLIVATDKGIFYKMRQAVPDKKLIPAPTFGDDATCTSCAHCPWMAMNSLMDLLRTLKTGSNEIIVDEILRQKALKSTERMFGFV